MLLYFTVKFNYLLIYKMENLERQSYYEDLFLQGGNEEELRALSGEEVYEGLMSVFSKGKVGEVLGKMEEAGSLEVVLPEVAVLRKQEQTPPHHTEGDVLEHTKFVCDALDEVVPIKNAEGEVQEGFGLRGVSDELILAAVLHDAGKPDVAKPHKDDEGQVTFYKHADESKKYAEQVCERLGVSGESAEKVVFLVENHMNIANFTKMKEKKAIKLMTDEEGGVNPWFEELIAIYAADTVATRPESEEDLAANWEDFEAVKARYLELKKKIEEAPKKEKKEELFSGKDLIERGVKPGPDMGKIIAQVKAELRKRGVKTREEALAVLDEILKNRREM